MATQEEGIFTGVPVEDHPLLSERQLEEGIFSAVPLVEDSNANDVYSAVPITTPVRRRRTPHNSDEEGELYDPHDEEEDERARRHRRHQDESVLRSLIPDNWEGFCIVLLLFVFFFCDFRIRLIRMSTDAVAAAASASRSIFSAKPTVWKDLNAREFQDVLQANPYTLVLFEAGKTSSLPTSAEIQKAFRGYNRPPRDPIIVRVDCVRQPQICRQNTIVALPTVRFHSNVQGVAAVSEVNPPHDRDSLVNNVNRKIRSLEPPPSSLWSKLVWGSQPIQAGPWPGPYRPSTLPTLTQTNFTQVLESQKKAIVIFTKAPPSQLQWWFRIWEDQAFWWENDETKFYLFQGDIIILPDGLVSPLDDMGDGLATVRFYRRGMAEVPDYQTPLVFAANKPKPPKLFVVDDLDAFLAQHEQAMVLFHDSSSSENTWDEACTEATTWVALRLQAENVPVVHALLVSQPRNLPSEQQPIHSPTIRWYRQGKLSADYRMAPFDQAVLLERLTLFARDQLSHATLDKMVPKLTADSFDQFLSLNDFVVVQFCVSWLDRCSTPVWDQVGEILEKDGVLVASVNCKQDEALCEQQQGIKGYPTYRWFERGHGHNDQRTKKPDTVEAMVAYTKQQFKLTDHF